MSISVSFVPDKLAIVAQNATCTFAYSGQIQHQYTALLQSPASFFLSIISEWVNETPLSVVYFLPYSFTYYSTDYQLTIINCNNLVGWSLCYSLLRTFCLCLVTIIGRRVCEAQVALSFIILKINLVSGPSVCLSAWSRPTQGIRTRIHTHIIPPICPLPQSSFSA